QTCALPIWDGDFAHHLLRRHLEALRLFLLALGSAAERGDGTGPVVVLIQCIGEGEFATALFSIRFGARRCRNLQLALDARPWLGLGLILIRGLSGALNGELLGSFLGFLAAFFLGAMTGIVVDLAAFGSFAFLAFAVFVLAPAQRFGFLTLAFLGLAHARIGESAITRLLLFRRQRAQHDTGALLVAYPGLVGLRCCHPRLCLELRLGGRF